MPLIAETGGINPMIVDATALPEQVTDDIIASAFRSAGQRCSALRLLCVQEDVADRIIEMITGAAHELELGDPRAPATEVGPGSTTTPGRAWSAGLPGWSVRGGCATAGMPSASCRRRAPMWHR